MIYLDTETCGLHGVPVIIQYMEKDKVSIHDIWGRPIQETLDLIEWFCYKGVCAFNIVFDWYHLNKIYNIFALYPDKNAYPEDHIKEIAQLQAEARDGKCLKPIVAFDLMLHARKGPYQSTMDRKDIKIKRVPTTIAYDLSEELENRVPLKDIYFARKVNKQKWQVEELDDPAFKDVVLRFAPSSALKALASDALGIQEDEILRFADIEIEKKAYPEVDLGYAPLANSWPQVLHHHIDHWRYNKLAREYAANDVLYLKQLYEYFGEPPTNDDDSVLACMIAAIRWKGFTIDLDKIRELRLSALDRATKAPTAPNYVKNYIWPLLSETEKSVIDSTKRVVLEEIAKWVDHPAAEKAQAVLDARIAQKEIELYDKLLLAGRLHASFKIIGTLSGRMSGADDLNAQAIKKDDEVRSCFPLAPGGMVLSGGDFDAFEVVIGVAYYNDQALYDELKKGKKIHALFGEELFPEETYESILATSGTSDDLYKKAKSALFAMGMYGGTGHTVKERLGIDEDQADAAKENWARRFPGIGKKQAEIYNKFCSMRQPGGLGTVVEWHEPDDHIESMLGFKRYFTLENNICKALFNLGENPPKHWLRHKFKVTRRDREQTATGAARSACFAAAFAIQGANLRAANNHVIQSTGAEITKHLQRKICELQPVGIHDWVVMPMNIHDEIMCPVIPKKVNVLKQLVLETIEEYRPVIPLIKIDWREQLGSWAYK